MSDPARYACLFVPDLPLAAALRADEALRGRAVAIVEAQPRGRTQSPAIVAGWMRGLTVAQARAIEPDLCVRTLSLEGVRSAEEALLDVAASVTPRVERARTGCVFLDLGGTRALYPSEPGLMAALEARLADVGLAGGVLPASIPATAARASAVHDGPSGSGPASARLGIGPTRTVAELAARYRSGGARVGPGEVAHFLAPLPLDLLEPDGELADQLWSWGVRTLGELAALPRAGLGARLGETGVTLARRAAGQDLTPFRPAPPPLRFEESAESDYGVAQLEALAFLLRGPLDRLTRRLRLRGLAVRQLRLELGLESGTTFARDIGVSAPTLEVSVLLALVRLALEATPPSEPVERLRLLATPGGVETAQLDFFLPPLPAPAELAVTVARLQALCGADRVGAPQVRDTHHPDAAERVDFELSPAPAASPQLPRGLDPSAITALRALRPPLAVRVLGANAPDRVLPLAADPRPGTRARRGDPGGFRGGRVRQSAGPWRLYGEWWGEGRFARDYYDVELADGGVYRLFQNLETRGWFVDGVYD